MDDYINVTIELDDVDITSAETKATYDEIKKPIGILQGKSLPIEAEQICNEAEIVDKERCICYAKYTRG